MYKVVHGMTPSIIKQYIILNTNVHSHNTRQAILFHIPNYRQNKFDTSLKYQGPLLWNALPSKIRESRTLFSFKLNAKRLISSNQ